MVQQSRPNAWIIRNIKTDNHRATDSKKLWLPDSMQHVIQFIRTLIKILILSIIENQWASREILVPNPCWTVGLPEWYWTSHYLYKIHFPEELFDWKSCCELCRAHVRNKKNWYLFVAVLSFHISTGWFVIRVWHTYPWWRIRGIQPLCALWGRGGTDLAVALNFRGKSTSTKIPAPFASKLERKVGASFLGQRCPHRCPLNAKTVSCVTLHFKFGTEERWCLGMILLSSIGLHLQLRGEQVIFLPPPPHWDTVITTTLSSQPAAERSFCGSPSLVSSWISRDQLGTLQSTIVHQFLNRPL